MIAEIVTTEGFLPHAESFGYHGALLDWYEAACWMAALAWVVNTFIVVRMRKHIPP